MLNKILPRPFTDEKPVLLLRRHWFVLTQHIAQAILLLLVPFLVLALLNILDVHLAIELGDPLFAIIVMFIIIYSGIILLFLFTSWLDYSLDIWLVTNYRIVSVEQMGLFNRTISEYRLDRMQDITSEVKGFIKTMVQFGDVRIQTASEQQQFILKDIPDPNAVTRRIIELQNDALLRSMHDTQDGLSGGQRIRPIPKQTDTQNPAQKN
ncbi:MAG: PH domain-containing protein [Patescibacteria group bacterium]|jgi:uncharacterized membrane protein YdbT with pleckstrin-like domain